MLRLSYVAVSVSLGTVLGLGSCGLIDTSVADVKLHLPRKDFQIDSADWHLGSGKVPAVSCSAGCETAAATLCSGGSCRTDCDQGTQRCQAHVPITLRNDFDLAAQAPEFQQIADHSFISVTVDDIFFDITENTLTVATPTLYVYMGPSSATATTDTGVAVVGIIDSLPPGTVGRRDVRFEGNGRQILKAYMDDFHTPFRVLVSGELTVRGGDDVPAGRLVGSVQADAHVGLD